MSDMTPVDIERELNRLRNAVPAAYWELKQARMAEVKAKHVLKRGETEAMFTEECPKVARGGATVAERDAWVYRATADEALAFDLAEVARKNAEDYVRQLQTEVSITQTEAKSVFQAFQIGGADR